MARHKTLQDTVDAVLREARATTNSAAGTDYRQNVKERIRTVQEFYYGEYDWPFMELKWGDAEKSLAAGQRYYDFPTSLNADKPFAVYYKHGEVWLQLEYGIHPEHYSSYDSDNDERADPALRWDFYDETQFEIWPIPASAGELRFLGGKALTDLVEDTDKLDLDDRMVVLHVAADMLDGANQRLADRKRAEADRRYWQQRANTHHDIGVRVGVDQRSYPPAMSETGWPRTIAVYNERDV